MNLDEGNKASPIVTMYQALQAKYPQWSVEMGQPRGGGLDFWDRLDDVQRGSTSGASRAHWRRPTHRR